MDYHIAFSPYFSYLALRENRRFSRENGSLFIKKMLHFHHIPDERKSIRGVYLLEGVDSETYFLPCSCKEEF